MKCQSFSPKNNLNDTTPGVDPGFPIGGGANPPGGAPTYNFAKFCKNCMKLRNFWAVGGHTPGAPPKSATAPSSVKI